MSYSIDADILLYDRNQEDSHFDSASRFISKRTNDPDLLCMTWPSIMAYQRNATHESIFENPLSPEIAWSNVVNLLNRPRATLIQEREGFAGAFETTPSALKVRGNSGPDAPIATILQQNGVNRIYTVDSDFRKFEFLEVINPL